MAKVREVISLAHSMDQLISMDEKTGHWSRNGRRRRSSSGSMQFIAIDRIKVILTTIVVISSTACLNSIGN